MTETMAIHAVLGAVVISSIAHALLPPYEIFKDFPRFQKYYKVFVITVGYIALNARGKMLQVYSSTKEKPDGK